MSKASPLSKSIPAVPMAMGKDGMAAQGARLASQLAPLWPLWLVVLTLMVRLPFLGNINDDEAFFSVIAQRWFAGEVPYRDIYDLKPPLLFAIVGLAQTLFGQSLLMLKGLEAICVIWAATGIYRLIAPNAGTKAALWGASLYPVYSLSLHGTYALNALLLMPFIIEAFVLARSHNGNLRTMALSGLMIGLALMIKQTAAFEGMAVVAFIALTTAGFARVKALLVFAAAALLPLIGFMIYFASQGALEPMLKAVIVSAIGRAEIGPMAQQGSFEALYLTPRETALRFLAMTAPLMGIMVLALLGFARARTIKGFSADWLMCGLWLGFAVTGIILAHALFSYYLIDLIAPLLIATNLLVFHGMAFRPQARGWMIAAIFTALLVYPLTMEHKSLLRQEELITDDYSLTQEAARTLKGLNAQPTDHMLVLNRGLYTYLLSGLTPTGHYTHALHLNCPFPTPDADPLAQAFRERPRFVMLGDPSITFVCQTPQIRQAINAHLKRDYVLKATPKGDFDTAYIYERKIR